MLAFPAMHRKRLRTANLLERINKELRRRTRVGTRFPNETALLRLLAAVLAEISAASEAERCISGWKTAVRQTRSTNFQNGAYFIVIFPTVCRLDTLLKHEVSLAFALLNLVISGLRP